MKWNTHMVLGLAVGTILAAKTGLPAAGAIISTAAAVIPDMDAVGAAAAFIKPVLGHRTATHSLLAVFVISYIAKLLYPAGWLFFAAGYGSHILADMLNPSGVQLFYPFGHKIGIPLVKTGGFVERFILFPMVCLVLVILSVQS